MARVSHFIMTTACWMGLAALSIAHPANAQDSMREANVDDLVCPASSISAPAPKTPSTHPAGSVSMVGNQMPSEEELGPLAKTVIRDQPVLDPQVIPGFAFGSQTAPRRFAVWGDSHIAAGSFMPTLMNALRVRGLSLAPHFLPPTMGRSNVKLMGLRAYCVGSGWSTEIAYTSAEPIDSGPGLANRVVDAGPQSYLWLDVRNTERQTNVQKLGLVYRATAGATISYSLNDGRPSSIVLPPSNDSQTVLLQSDQLISTIKLRITEGKLVLHGVTLDYAQPPTISFDVFGIPSATVRGWANIDPSYLAQTLHDTNYDGVILEYGTNEGAAPDFDADKYAATLTEALTHMRQVIPSASCLLVGPPDRGVLRAGRGPRLSLLNYSRIHQQIEAIQQQVGQRFGCIAWNWQDLMGGPGGSYGWAHATPSLMGRDLIHLSPNGYQRTGQALAHSLGWGP
jgi:lysophospholipase L1-like esterase